jgi:uncharacterized protein YndB with AHSA1/START domain
MAKLKTMPAPNPAHVRVSQLFHVPAERVFDSWITPTAIGRWMFGKSVRDEEIIHIKLDPHIGGSYSFLVRRNGVEIDHIGEFLEIQRPTKLVITWGVRADNVRSRVAVEITPDKLGCELVLTHELAPGWEAYVDRVRESWTKMLAALEASLD